MMPEKVDETFVRCHEVPLCESGAWSDGFTDSPGCGKPSVVCLEYVDGAVWLCQEHYDQERAAFKEAYADPDCPLDEYDVREIPRPPYRTEP